MDGSLQAEGYISVICEERVLSESFREEEGPHLEPGWSLRMGRAVSIAQAQQTLQRAVRSGFRESCWNCSGFSKPCPGPPMGEPSGLVTIHLHEWLGERPFAQTLELPTSPNPQTR